MPIIYMNSFLYSGELSKTNFLTHLDDHSRDLSNISSMFSDLTSYMRSEGIKVEEVAGVPFGGSFKVSDEDAKKLMSKGLVADCSEPDYQEYKEPENIPIFYIDTKLDEMIESRDSFLGLPTVSLNIPSFSNSESNLESNDYGLSGDKQVVIDLGKMLKDFPIASSFINIDTESLEEDKWSFNIGISDIGYTVKEINFDRSKCSFTFLCDACEDLHKSNLKSVYTSLSTGIALLSNIIAYSSNREFIIAFDYINRDLRLLKTLLELDYAVGS